MNRKVLFGAIGFLVGVITGGFLGLIVGGFDIHEAIGLEGYELAAYIEALIGGIAIAIARVKLTGKMQKGR